MDGSIEPVPTLRPDGSAEALTVTPAFFAAGGWLAPTAKAQNRGATLTAEMAVAVKYRPTVLLVCQWNEWAGQPDGTVRMGLSSTHALSYIMTAPYSQERSHRARAPSGAGKWFRRCIQPLVHE